MDTPIKELVNVVCEKEMVATQQKKNARWNRLIDEALNGSYPAREELAKAGFTFLLRDGKELYI